MFSKANHKFVIEFSLINNSTGENKILPKALSAIAIKKNYSTNILSLFVITLSVSEEDRRYIVSNDVDVSLHISRYSINEENSGGETGTADTPTIDKEICSLILHPYDKPKIYNNINSSDIDDSNEKENIEEQKVSYVLNCIPKEQIDYNKTIINECFAGANLNEICINILSNLYKKDIYFQESKNTKRFDSLLIPPMSISNAMNYLQSNYMIYKDNLNLFFDDSKLYVYNIRESERKFRNSLLIEIKDPANNSDKTIYQSAQIDDNDNVRIYLENNPSIISYKDAYKNAIGTQTIFNSYDDNFNLVSRTYTDSKIDKTRYFWNNDRMQEFEKKNVNNIYQYTSIFQYNLDAGLITPDTQIIISGSNLQEINGEYALLSEEIFYSTEDFVNYTESCRFSLGLIK